MNNKIALLLDDNLMSTVRVQAQLDKAGYHVRTARKVLDATDEEAPQLILINLGSRTLDGVALIGECRARYPQAKVLGFCGHLEKEIRRAARAAGIDKILTNEQALSQLAETL